MTTWSDASSKRRRTDDEDDVPGQQRMRADVHMMQVALEYQRHIHRITAFVHVDTKVSLDTPLVCTVTAAHDGAYLAFEHAVLEPVRFAVPWQVVPGTYSSAFCDGYVVMLPTHPAPRTREAPPSSPWHAFVKAEISALQCAHCAHALVKFPTHASLRALPSDHWEELVDAWMCHGDQRLNASVTQGRRDVDVHRVPKDNELWIASLWLKTSSVPIVAGTVRTLAAQDNFSEVCTREGENA